VIFGERGDDRSQFWFSPIFHAGSHDAGEIGIPMPQLTWDQFMDLEDDWSMREERF
jgi:hypothetical protein